jgi:hypothetical protein
MTKITDGGVLLAPSLNFNGPAEALNASINSPNFEMKPAVSPS